MSDYSPAQRRQVRNAVFVAGVLGYAGLATAVFPLDGSSDEFGRALLLGLAGVVALLGSVAGLAAWRARAPGIFNAASSTLIWVGVWSLVVIAAAMPNAYAEVGLTGELVAPLRVAASCLVVPLAAGVTAHWTADAASTDRIIAGD